MAEWINPSDALPTDHQWITAEIEYAGEVTSVAGRYAGNGEVVFDFYSGTAGAEIRRWKPRTPSGEPGHPWTSIERGVAAAIPERMTTPSDAPEGSK